MAKSASKKSDQPASTPVETKTPAPKSTKGRDTLKALRQDLDKIEGRLKKADTLTNNSVKTLETSFTVLENRMNEKTDKNFTTLKSHLQQLATQLREQNVSTRDAVRTDLKAALAKAGTGDLNAAIQNVQTRLDAAEKDQSDAIRKVNRHIADLAIAIDKRIKSETDSRQKALKAVAERVDMGLAKTHVKLNRIETATADAIRSLGDKVGTIADDLHSKTARSAAALQQKLIEREDSTRTNMKTLQAKLERRLESLEETQRNLDSYTDRTVANLTARIDSLEYGLSSGFAPGAHTESGTISDGPTAFVPAAIDDAFTPSQKPSQVVEPEPDPALSELMAHAEQTKLNPQDMSGQPVIEEFVPTEFEPANAAGGQFVYAAPDQAVPPSDPYNQTEYNPSYPAGPQGGGDPVYTQNPPFESYTPAPTMGQDAFVQPDNVTPFPEPIAISDADLPYENPAYAETNTGNRPGGFGAAANDGKSAFAAGRSLKVAGVAIAVAALGVFALRGGQPIPGLGGNNSGTTQSAGTNSGSTQSDLTQPVSVDMAPPVGDYADNRGLDTSAFDAAALKNVESAAEAGHPIAQFQLGLTYLEQGRTDDGVKLIRASANQNQPAAQYRLAKLYETGTGVTADADMARQLTERAATNGNRIAMHELALYYAEGRGGVTPDIKTAAAWFEKAAERGVVDSQFNLGVLYESGQGLPKNMTDAYVWYAIAAKQGDQFARDRVKILKDQLDADQLSTADNRVDVFQPMRIDEQANGIFHNVPWSTDKRSANTASTDMVRDAQALLADLGYEVGTPDGAMGPKTREAIISFQRTKGLQQSGDVSAALIGELEQAGGA